ncbi:MAG TPA: bifunctional serine/threonine-protein kinase/formylglycine-generating enzyme family protein [Acidobacteriota bacterium]|nr:bifunctional serine/threonine-protein kinase/formylglycine-generating enzyme family protein [Acidobacteriota bacterium]
MVSSGQPPKQRNSSLPKRIGKYQIVEMLGKGGMGTVYKGYDSSLQRFAAIKVMEEIHRRDEDLRERFFREARAVARLDHENIVAIYELDEDPKLPFIAMEYVEGMDLHQLLKRGRLPLLRDSLRMVIEVCRGLGHAHGRDLVHRDIKPSNIRLGPNRKVKLLDFGIARLHEEPDTKRLTQTGQIVGTPDYMSPEQAAGEKEVDLRSDIFSLGSVLYELLASKPPFSSSKVSTTLARIISASHPPLQTIYPGFPCEMERIVERALAKSPNNRYQSCAEMEADLSAFLKNLPDHYKKTLAVVRKLEEQLRVTQTGVEGDDLDLRPRREGVEDLGILLDYGRDLRRALAALDTEPAQYRRQYRAAHKAWLPRWAWITLSAILLAAVGATWYLASDGSGSDSPGGTGQAAAEEQRGGIPGSDSGSQDGRSPPPVTGAAGGSADFPATITLGGTEMVLVPAGEFLMGSSFGEGWLDQDGLENESPQRRLFLKAFYIDRFEVSNRRFLEFVRDTGRTQPLGPAFDPDYFYTKPDYPAVGADWGSAREFCLWKGQRLPNEAEWEKAARGPEGRPYPWGEAFEEHLANLGGPDDYPELAPCGVFPRDRSPYGVMDMAGNVSEWVADDYRLYPGNPGAIPAEQRGHKVIKGGFFGINRFRDKLARAAYRLPMKPEAQLPAIGFRCAADAKAALGLSPSQ